MVMEVLGRMLGIVFIAIAIYFPFFYLLKKFKRIKGTKYRRGIIGYISYLLDRLIDSDWVWGWSVGLWFFAVMTGALLIIFGL